MADAEALISRIEAMATVREMDVPKLHRVHQDGHAARVAEEVADLRAIAQLARRATDAGKD